MYDRISLMSIDFSKAVRIPECIDDSTWWSLDTESLVDTLDLNLQNDKYRKQQDPIYNNPSKRKYITYQVLVKIILHKFLNCSKKKCLIHIDL